MNHHFLVLLGVIVGFLGKYAWDLSRRKTLGQTRRSQFRRIEILERQLGEFYWPILVQLRKNNTVWKRMMAAKEQADDLDKNLRIKLPREYFFPNNEKILKIIEEKFCLSLPPENVKIQIELFIRHQAVLQAITQTISKNVDPIEFGEPWPNRLQPAMEEHTAKLQQEYDELVKRLSLSRSDKQAGLPGVEPGPSNDDVD